MKITFVCVCVCYLWEIGHDSIAPITRIARSINLTPPIWNNRWLLANGECSSSWWLWLGIKWEKAKRRDEDYMLSWTNWALSFPPSRLSLLVRTFVRSSSSGGSYVNFVRWCVASKLPVICITLASGCPAPTAVASLTFNAHIERKKRKKMQMNDLNVSYCQAFFFSFHHHHRLYTRWVRTTWKVEI